MGTPDEDLEQKIAKVKELTAELDKISNSAKRQDQIDMINKEIKAANELVKANGSISGSLKEQLQDLEKNQVTLTGMLGVNKSIVSTFKDMTEKSRNFATSTSAWFNKGQELATQYLSISKNIGLSSNRTKDLSGNFNKTVAEALRLGVELTDIDEIFTSFADETGRARILGDDEAKNIAKYSAGIGTSTTEAAKLAEQFDLMGLSSEKVFGPSGFINEAIGSSREMGLNSNKVIKTLQSNMKTMQQYSFSNGVKGMVNMAKQAVKMRVDVGDILQMSDKFYQPEAAIEAAANLQLLGGDIAEAFGDPFQVMYEARNKPEELAKRVGKMTENMVSFNEQTGEFDMPAEARMQLQAVSKELGIGMDSLTEMTRQASKIKSIKMNVSGNILDEDMREGIAGMAKMKDGEWKVNFEGEDIGIGELDKTMAKSLLDQKEEFADKTEKDLLSDIALNTQTFKEMTENQQAAREYGFAADTGTYEVTMDSFLKETVKSYDSKVTRMFTAVEGAITGGGGIKKVMEDAFGAGGADGENFITTGLRVAMDNITNAIQGQVKDGEFSVDSMSSKVDNAKIFLGGVFGVDDVQMDTGGKTFVSGPAGTFTLNDKDSYHGKDGMFTAGTNLGVDEKIKNVSTSKSSAKTSSEMKIGGTATVNVNIKTDNPSLDLSQHTDVIARTVTKILSNGSQPDGARLPQEGGPNVLQST